jgi:hypothetical protein
MPHQFTKTTRTSWGSKIVGSIKGIFTGIILFIVSFGVLYWNEGRIDVSDIAKNSVEIEANEISAEADGEFVSLTGTLSSEEQLGDGLYLKPGDYLAVSRSVEVYSWEEHTETTTEKNLGGSETHETTYTYTKDWTSTPSATSSFEYPEDHENVGKGLEDYSATVNSAKIGVYDVDMKKLSLAGYEKLSLNEDVVDLGTVVEIKVESDEDVFKEVEEEEFGDDDEWGLGEEEFGDDDEWGLGEEEVDDDDEWGLGEEEGDAFDDWFEEESVEESVKKGTEGPVLSGGYIFVGEGTLTSPEVGDMKISYRVIENNIEGTVFGKVDGTDIVTYVDEDTDNSLYRFFNGSREEAFQTLHGEYKMMLWIFRLVGFLMMWMGLSALFAPISVLLDVVPAFGSLSRGIIGFITFIASLVLSIVTIIVSMILHNIVSLIIAVVITALLILYILKKKGQKPNVVQA